MLKAQFNITDHIKSFIYENTCQCVLRKLLYLHIIKISCNIFVRIAIVTHFHNHHYRNQCW
jgi:hypothetical protein